LGGLLHDLGVIVNLWIFPKEFGCAVNTAAAQHIPLHEAESKILEFTHCESGAMLARKWNLAPDLVAVVEHHHTTESSADSLVAIVSLSDLLCRMENLGHGFVEERQVNILGEVALTTLLESHPGLQQFDWARLTFELESYVDEVHQLVASIYRPQ
jgi:hypothetical protein